MAVEAFSDHLNAIGRIPLLTEEEELVLARLVQGWVEVRDLPNPTPEQRRAIRAGRKAYDRFFSANCRLVISVVRKSAYKALELEFADLCQEGYIGLGKAIERFDPSRGYKFSTYAYWWIRQSVTRSIDNFDRLIRLPITGISSLSKLSRFVPEFIFLHGRSPTMDEMVEHTGSTPASIEHYLKHSLRPRSLDVAPVGLANSSDREKSTLKDILVDDCEDPVDVLIKDERLNTVETLLGVLDPMDRELVQRYYGIDRTQQSLRDIGDEMGMCRTRISDRITKAKRAMHLHARALRTRDSFKRAA